jgi:PRC-barrel domain
MNEHHTAGVASARGNSAVNSPVSSGEQARFRDSAGRAEAFRPEHYMPRRDETVRSGQRDWYQPTRRTRENDESNTIPILALGIGSGLLAGWLLASIGARKHGRNRWEERWPERRSFERQSPYSNRHSVALDETRDLIASDKVEGTAVYDRNGERLGSVYNFMVGKRTGQVAYAVMSFGGWLGMGQSYHPLPWHTLTYDTDRGGYVVNLTKERLRNAPSHTAGHDTTADPTYWQRVKDYWA